MIIWCTFLSQMNPAQQRHQLEWPSSLIWVPHNSYSTVLWFGLHSSLRWLPHRCTLSGPPKKQSNSWVDNFYTPVSRTTATLVMLSGPPKISPAGNWIFLFCSLVSQVTAIRLNVKWPTWSRTTTLNWCILISDECPTIYCKTPPKHKLSNRSFTYSQKQKCGKFHHTWGPVSHIHKRL